MKNMIRLLALLLALVMFGGVAIAEETEEVADLLLVTVNGAEVYSSTVMDMAQMLYEYGYLSSDEDYLTTLQYIMSTHVEEQQIKIKEDEIAEARWCTPEEALQLIRKGTTAEFFLNNAVRELKKKI